MIRIAVGLLALTALMVASENVTSVVPEPSTYLMMGAGLGTLLYVRNKFGKKK